MVTISLQLFSFLLMLPVLTIGIGMWLMAFVNAPGRYEHNELSKQEETGSPLERQGTLSEMPRSKSRGELKLAGEKPNPELKIIF
jgi:hypothetical protein